MNRLITILMTFMAIGLLATATPVLAQATDNSQCDDFKGLALSLCEAGVALGCDSDSGNPACANIEETFRNIAGVAPPWTTEFTCPCWAGLTVYELAMMVGDWIAGSPNPPWCQLSRLDINGPGTVMNYSASIYVPNGYTPSGIEAYATLQGVFVCRIRVDGRVVVIEELRSRAIASSCMAEIDQVIAMTPEC